LAEWDASYLPVEEKHDQVAIKVKITARRSPISEILENFSRKELPLEEVSTTTKLHLIIQFHPVNAA
jgi:hypothetical protein